LTAPLSTDIFPAMARRTGTPEHRPPSLRWSPVNYAFLGAGLVSIALGFVLLAQGSIVGAPLLLALGYVVLVPLGIIR
jgi:hypothetical protein